MGLPQKNFHIAEAEKRRAVASDILTKLLEQVDHKIIKKLYETDCELKENDWWEGLSIRRLYRLSIEKKLKEGAYDGMTIKEVAKIENVSLRTLYRIYNDYYRRRRIDNAKKNRQ